MSTSTDNLPDIAQMTMSLARRMDSANEIAPVCGRLMQVLAQGSVCLPLSSGETALMAKSPVVSVAPEHDGILVLDGNRLYTRRNWQYEQAIKSRILAMAAAPPSQKAAIPDNDVFASLNALQRTAVESMCENKLSLLTGGPGTGKTFTIARAVKLALDQNPHLRIGLAAPTGKAAARVRDAMLAESHSLGLADNIAASTIHALLRPNRDWVTFKHNRNNPCLLDWLIVDECSMLDLPLMAKLLDALPDSCRLTLVGDANQLASVEPGHLFGDLSRMPRIPIVRLKESRRFPSDGEIYQLSEAVNAKNAEETLRLLKRQGNAFVHYYPMTRDSMHAIWRGFRETASRLFGDFSRQTTPEGALRAMNDCRILCPFREGPCGVASINRELQRILGEKSPVPMMVTRNNSSLNVSNGDVGVVLPDRPGLLWLGTEDGAVRSIPRALLLDTEPAFASSIHKAQGSEFKDVIIVIPPYELSENARSLLTREILYTALTRTKRQVFLYASDQSVTLCCTQETQRFSGLAT